ncbi:MAG: 3-dehydro-bile acid delta(4,6)-reductase [Chlamydiae bacterium]|nr:3-dehydro-bile acid delta(4,6)-reductase [Chlamydiota bacterium]
MVSDFSILVVGGGAAGFFAAISAKLAYPRSHVVLLEKNASLLSKVRVSGGGRCNVTHACFDPLTLIKNYPRGGKELLGPFHRFQPKDTCNWFEKRGVPLKAEEDGRMFPVSNTSASIIDCLVNEAKRLNISILTQQKIESISKAKDNFCIQFKKSETLYFDRVILTTGSSSQGYQWSKSLGHSIQPQVPSLFTFNSPTSPLKELSGISFNEVKAHIKKSSFEQIGPLLITHFGFSGPAILKLSAWAAKLLHEKNYSFELEVNWVPHLSFDQSAIKLTKLKDTFPNKRLVSENLFHLPKNFWKTFLKIQGHHEEKRLNDFSKHDIKELAKGLTSASYQIEGKTTHKEEFVTCGGVSLKEINFKTMESKICPGLFFAGEILDIDGITGGFNFQNAWTTGYISGQA